MKVCPSCGNTYEDTVGFCPEEGIQLVPLVEKKSHDHDLVGERLFGDYLLTKKLGEGGMGAVYLAENKAIDQKIAVKVLHPSSAGSDEILQRFNREANTIARLTHPNTIRVFIFGKTPESMIYMAMEYVSGISLREEMYQRGPFDEQRAIAIMRQVLHALAEAHEMGIIHRDLKPDNIMLTHFRGVDDYVKVLDFGIAKMTGPDGDNQRKLTQAGVVYGTPEYLSPEQARGRDIDHRVDLYAMGIILYEMITGVVPFTGDTALKILSGHVYQPPPDPMTISDVRVAKPMRDIIMRAIQKKPEDRFQNGMEFLEALEKRESELLGGKSFKTTMLDIREAGMVFEVAKAAREAKVIASAETVKHTTAPTAIPAAAPTMATPVANPSAKSQQHSLILALGIGFGVMTIIAISLLFKLLT